MHLIPTYIHIVSTLLWLFVESCFLKFIHINTYYIIILIFIIVIIHERASCFLRTFLECNDLVIYGTVDVSLRVCIGGDCWGGKQESKVAKKRIPKQYHSLHWILTWMNSF